MPLTVSGENYREFSEPRFFECETVAHVRAIPWPTNRAFAMQGTASGGSLKLYKFDSASVAADNGGTILLPINPAFATAGRWLAVLTGGGGVSGGAIINNYAPEGATSADPGQWAWDDRPLPDGQALYLKLTGTGDTGWLQILQFGE